MRKMFSKRLNLFYFMTIAVLCQLFCLNKNICSAVITSNRKGDITKISNGDVLSFEDLEKIVFDLRKLIPYETENFLLFPDFKTPFNRHFNIELLFSDPNEPTNRVFGINEKTIEYLRNGPNGKMLCDVIDLVIKFNNFAILVSDSGSKDLNSNLLNHRNKLSYIVETFNKFSKKRFNSNQRKILKSDTKLKILELDGRLEAQTKEIFLNNPVVIKKVLARVKCGYCKRKNKTDEGKDHIIELFTVNHYLSQLASIEPKKEICINLEGYDELDLLDAKGGLSRNSNFIYDPRRYFGDEEKFD